MTPPARGDGVKCWCARLSRSKGDLGRPSIRMRVRGGERGEGGEESEEWGEEGRGK